MGLLQRRIDPGRNTRWVKVNAIISDEIGETKRLIVVNDETDDYEFVANKATQRKDASDLHKALMDLLPYGTYLALYTLMKLNQQKLWKVSHYERKSEQGKGTQLRKEDSK